MEDKCVESAVDAVCSDLLRNSHVFDLRVARSRAKRITGAITPRYIPSERRWRFIVGWMVMSRHIQFPTYLCDLAAGQTKEKLAACYREFLLSETVGDAVLGIQRRQSGARELGAALLTEFAGKFCLLLETAGTASRALNAAKERKLTLQLTHLGHCEKCDGTLRIAEDCVFLSCGELVHIPCTFGTRRLDADILCPVHQNHLNGTPRVAL
jgi:hypothetical protein